MQIDGYLVNVKWYKIKAHLFTVCYYTMGLILALGMFYGFGLIAQHLGWLDWGEPWTFKNGEIWLHATHPTNVMIDGAQLWLVVSVFGILLHGIYEEYVDVEKVDDL